MKPVQHIVNVYGGKDSIERWAQAHGYGGFYEVSDRGRVRSLSRITSDGKNIRGRILKLHQRKGKYTTVHFSVNGNSKTVGVHALVARAFVTDWFEGAEVNHEDGQKHRNHWTNLKWFTRSQNNEHRYRVLKHPPVRSRLGKCGAQHPRSMPVIGTPLMQGPPLHFESARLAASKGFHQSAVSKCARGEQVSHKGYRWAYGTTSGCQSSYGLCE